MTKEQEHASLPRTERTFAPENVPHMPRRQALDPPAAKKKDRTPLFAALGTAALMAAAIGYFAIAPQGENGIANPEGLSDTTAAETANASPITPGSADNFVTVWDTGLYGYGDERDSTIWIPGGAEAGHAYHLYWEEVGRPENHATLANISDEDDHIISGLRPGGKYRVEIAGRFPRFFMGQYGGGYLNGLVEVKQWGKIPWETFELAFTGCENLEVSATDTPDLRRVASTAYMFANCASLTGRNANWNWNTASVENMNGMFANTPFNGEIGSWNTGKVTDMGGMFAGAKLFNRDIGAWNTAKVASMEAMFDGARSFNRDISGWDTRSARYMAGMFKDASAFNQDISRWNLQKAEHMWGFLSGAQFFNQDLGHWRLNAVRIISLNGSGMDCENYARTLAGWAANPNLSTGATLEANGLAYAEEAREAHEHLAEQKEWKIKGDRLSADCGN